MKTPGGDWGILLVSIILAILLPWWVFALLPFVSLLLLILICSLFRWK